MWQNINIRDMAKQQPSALNACLSSHAKIFDHLRDFSMRQLPDEVVEILLPEDEDENGDVQPSLDVETQALEREDETPEMAPFSLDEPPHQDNEPEVAIDIEAIEQKAFARGQEAALADYEQSRAELIANHQRALAEARQTTLNTIARDLVEACHQGFSALQNKLEQHIAQLVKPLAEEKYTHKAVAEFAQTLAREAFTADAPLILEGDQKLLDAFIVQAKSEPTLDLSHYQLKAQSNGPLRLIIGDTVISTRISPLLQQLRDMI